MLHLPRVPMQMVGMANPHSYTPVGDITVTGLCMLIFLLLMQTSVHKNKRFKLLVAMLMANIAASYTDIAYQMLLYSGTVHPVMTHVFRILHHISMTLILFLTIRYLQEPLWIRSDAQKRYSVMTVVVLILSIAFDVIGSFLHLTFYMDGDGTIHMGFNVFIIVYALFIGSIFYLIVHYRTRIIKQIFWGLLGSYVISMLILAIQGPFQQVSFTGVSYFLPIMAIVFMFHSNPFDLTTGAASETYLYQSLETAQEKKDKLVLLSCRMPGFFKTLETNNDLKLEYNRFFRQNIPKGVVFRCTDDRLILSFKKFDDPDAQNDMLDKVLENFRNSHKKFEIDYKIVVMETTPDIQSAADYIHIIESTEQAMPFNTAHFVGNSDIRRFYGGNYILSELADISRRKDLDDERVLVYCQPVFNISTGTYDTAEALMRLKLPKTGMVYPDQFIPLAEQNGYIHMMSMIILNKTCGAIRTLIEDGLDINRISVNFSTLDIRYDSFCKEVQQIIDRNQIPYHKIAIEITESRSEADFHIMKEKVQELQKLGIKFYLDDFGTGYSNFERIMEIPFDIIKFDRSMTIESSKSENSFYMVSTFANMFSKLHYSVLFEGIEDENDEKNCVKMSAKYLQGYKYSKPIPIEELAGFLDMKAS